MLLLLLGLTKKRLGDNPVDFVNVADVDGDDDAADVAVHAVVDGAVVDGAVVDGGVGAGSGGVAVVAVGGAAAEGSTQVVQVLLRYCCWGDGSWGQHCLSVADT